MSQGLILKSDSEINIREFIDDTQSIACEWNHKLQFCQLFDTSDEIHHEMKTLHLSRMVHLKTMIREYVHNQKIHTFALVCFIHTNELCEDRLALAFSYIISAHVIVLKNRCFVCKKTNSQLCSLCNRAFYCSRECQFIDYPNHKDHCQKPTKELNHED